MGCQRGRRGRQREGKEEEGLRGGEMRYDDRLKI